MTALSTHRLTPRRDAILLSLSLAAGTTVYKGGIVAIDASGNAVPASANNTLTVLGRAEETTVNTGAAGAELAEVRAGCFRYANSAGGDAVSAKDRGSLCYIVDDQTLALTSSNGSRPVAGVVVDVDSTGVWVDLGPGAVAAAGVQGDRLSLVQDVTGLDAAATHRVVAPIACRVAAIYSVIDGVLTTADEVLTAKIGGVAITDGVITIAYDGSAAGDVDVATPSGANEAAAGDVLSVDVAGNNGTASNARLTWVLEAL